MKSERRHDLKENALAKKIIELPDFRRKWGGRLALAALAVVVVGALIYNRMNAAEGRHREAEVQLTLARGLADELRFAPFDPSRPIEPRDISVRQTAYDKGRAAVERVRELTSDNKLLAQASITEADLAFALANLPVPPGAATRPAEFATRPPRDELMKQAAASYQDVIDHYADQPVAFANARLGLATINENRGDWDMANTQYQALRTASSVPQMYRQIAENRAKQLEQIKQPALLVAREVPPLLSPTTAPTSAPTTAPATAPAAAPVAKPAAAPTTKPASAPSTKP